MKPKIYNVELIHTGSDRPSVIKTYRDVTGMGLKDAAERYAQLLQSAKQVALSRYMRTQSGKKY